MREKRATAYLLFTLLFLLALTSHPAISEEITPEALFLTVYPDGFVFIDYKLLVDPTFPTQNITVFGQVLEDLLVVNKDGLPLDYSLTDSTISVYSLGTDEVEITYLTQDLTSKEGRFWTLNITAPITTMIILPEETTIISLNQVPETIMTSDNKVELQMNASLIEVTYVIGVVGTKEHAQIVLDEAETTINGITSLGINITEAETKLTEALDAFNLGNYVEAETLGNEAKNLAIQINQTATQAQLQIDEAEDAITNAQNEVRTLGLTEAQDLLNQANSAYDNGDYTQASNLAIQAKTKAEGAETPLSDEDVTSQPEETEPLLLYGILAAILAPAIIAICFFVYRSRRKPKDHEIRKKKRRIDIERIFREHKDLMPEEKQAIQFLVDNNGEAFEAELYDYVKLPRTTTWRLVKRLEGMSIIRTSKFRRQNLIRVKNKYDIKE
ncbi:MAG: hypothetical protein JSW14_03825 [Candidatus Bathyarchaeum sp.]|nr:MAG: hypothetical protein JSW14_03825 [Candidatus Bathyarchaeum sp.]